MEIRLDYGALMYNRQRFRPNLDPLVVVASGLAAGDQPFDRIRSDHAAKNISNASGEMHRGYETASSQLSARRYVQCVEILLFDPVNCFRQLNNIINNTTKSIHLVQRFFVPKFTKRIQST